MDISTYCDQIWLTYMITVLWKFNNGLQYCHNMPKNCHNTATMLIQYCELFSNMLNNGIEHKVTKNAKDLVINSHCYHIHKNYMQICNIFIYLQELLLCPHLVDGNKLFSFFFKARNSCWSLMGSLNWLSTAC